VVARTSWPVSKGQSVRVVVRMRTDDSHTPATEHPVRWGVVTGSMPRLDREELLARTDLAALATEVCGEPRGRGRSARWHCPNPDHPDAHPSMGIYRRGRGPARWKCHACGEGGTAVDLLMISAGVGAGEALRELARTAGLTPPEPAQRPHGRPRALQPPPGTAMPTVAAPPPAPDPSVERFVAAAAEMLWQPVGDVARRHLRARGFAEDLLRANRVGFDPGPALLPRPGGLPRRGPGVVFPALDPVSGTAVYFQVRSLSPRFAAERKYDQPVVQLAPNPRLAAVRVSGTPVLGLLVICEGFPDALTVAQAGLPAIAVLGVSHAGPENAGDLARRILTDHAHPAYAVCFDSDVRGVQSAARLADRLARLGATVARLVPPAGHKDLNDWWQANPQELARQLGDTSPLLAERAVAARGPDSQLPLAASHPQLDADLQPVVNGRGRLELAASPR
jgi:hypothetical protein